MKKLITLFLAITAMTITSVSCSKDDAAESLTVNSDNLAGKWISTTYTTTMSGTTTAPTKTDPDGCNKQSFLNFKKDGTFQQYMVNKDCSDATYTGTWTLDKGVIKTVDTENYEIDFTVVSVSKNQLLLKQYTLPGVEEVYVTYTLKK